MPIASPSRGSLPLWPGLVLAIGGGAVILLSFLLKSPGDYVDWPLASVLTVERLLPLLGLGILIGQLPRKALARAVVLLLAGIALGFVLREKFYELMAPVPGAAANMFLAGPMACLLIGFPLVLPRGIRPWLALPLLVPAGAVLAIAGLLGDATLHARSYLPSACFAEIWIVAGMAFLAAAFRQAWAMIGARIFASWLIAIGFLYGGAHLAAKQNGLVPPPFPAVAETGEFAGFETVLEQLDRAGEAK